MHADTAKDIADALEVRDKRIAELEAEIKRLHQFVYDCGACVGCLLYRDHCKCDTETGGESKHMAVDPEEWRHFPGTNDYEELRG